MHPGRSPNHVVASIPLARKEFFCSTFLQTVEPTGIEPVTSCLQRASDVDELTVS